jgi:histidinol-phosphate/aromatic aminotransferase/cobyric acid decarboxylase-like protein
MLHDQATCYHGGAFFEAIGDAFDDLERRHDIINADVLDAWFPPAPGVLQALDAHLDWLARTSPPTNCEGLVRTIAEVRGVPAECVLPGAGSSDLIYRAFGRWLEPDSRVLLLDPTYGEYAHVCHQVIGCTVERLTLERETNYRLDLEQLHTRLQFGGFDLAVLVNPNNPTGQHVPRSSLQKILEDLPKTTLAWIDEAYLDYVGAGESLERFAAARPNVVVCKSLSKAYALSGMRAAYLCGCPELIARLRARTPPWVIGLPAQVAAVLALPDPAYYQARYRETCQLRGQLIARLAGLAHDWDIIDGVANFVLCHLPVTGPTAAEIVQHCRGRGVYLRDAADMGTGLGRHALRIAVKDELAQDRIVDALAEFYCVRTASVGASARRGISRCNGHVGLTPRRSPRNTLATIHSSYSEITLAARCRLAIRWQVAYRRKEQTSKNGANHDGRTTRETPGHQCGWLRAACPSATIHPLSIAANPGHSR